MRSKDSTQAVLLHVLLLVMVATIMATGCSTPQKMPPAIKIVGPRHTYDTTFESPISQERNWINGQKAGLNWSNVHITKGFAFGSQTGSGGYDDSTAVLAGTWGANQMAQAKVYTVNQMGGTVYEEVELRLRTTITPHTIRGYEINFRCTSDGSQYVQIVRWNGPFGDFSYVSTLFGGPGLSNGDLVKATVVGHKIIAYINGAPVLQGIDETISDGSPGIGFYLKGRANVNEDYGFTNFLAMDDFTPD